MLILVGAGIIIYEATRRLATGAEVGDLGVGIAVIGFSMVANVAVSTFLSRRARALDSPALEGDAAHLRTDALTSLGVLVGLLLAEITGEAAFDAIAALCVAAAIVVAGIRLLSRSSRVLVDEAPPPEELDRIEAAIAAERAHHPEIAGYHKLRARRGGPRRYIDLHLQFRKGTTLELAHELTHEVRESIEGSIPNSEVLIHVEPEESLRPADQERAGPFRAG
jgi:cation diffusion facilitator family transporter